MSQSDTVSNGQSSADEPELVDDVTASEMLGVSRRTLQAWRVRGTPEGVELPYVKLGSSVRYKKKDVLDLIEERTIESKSKVDAREEEKS